MKNPIDNIKHPVKYDSKWGTYIHDADDKMIADVRGWGWIQKLKNPENVQDSIGVFIAAAINEKLDRERRPGNPSINSNSSDKTEGEHEDE